MDILVAYASKHGATAEIACFMAQRLRQKGHDVTVAQAGAVGRVDEFNAAIIGGSLYAGKWPKEAKRFALDHAGSLRHIPVWLFSSGPIGDSISSEDLQPSCLGRLVTAIAPVEHKIFGGRLEKARLTLSERVMMKAVGAAEGDFRHWDVIAAWADSIASDLDKPSRIAAR